MNKNPLFVQNGSVDFSLVEVQHIVPAIQSVISVCSEMFEKILETNDHNYTTLFRKLDDIHAQIDRVWSPICVINFLANSPKVREEYNKGRQLLTEFETMLKSNSRIYEHLEKFSNKISSLNTEEKMVCKNHLREFRLNGAALKEEDKAKYKKIVLDLSNLQAKFGENVLDATSQFQLFIHNENELSGLPKSIKTSLREEAKKVDQDGFLCTLQMPVITAILKYADDENLRKKIYLANSSRGLDKEQDNRPNIGKILKLRKELADLLEFNTYADLSLAKKTAESPQEVLDFLYSLEEKTREQAKKEYEELQAFKKKYNETPLEPWDYAYYLEKLRQEKFDFSEEELRNYFSIDASLKGLFQIVKKIYGVTVIETEKKKCWHPEVRYFQVKDEEDILGEFFLDFHPRKNKRSGAWMQDIVGRIRKENGFEIPVGLIGGNATCPTEDTPALLAHREVVTLFHEFGHMSQFIFSKCKEYSVSGINGVPWDVVELPSQFLENWAWNKEALKMFACHYETGESIPDALCDKLIASRNFFQATQIRRQLEFALLDMHLHYDYDGTPLFSFSKQIHDKLSHFPLIEDTLFLAAFNHIFAGGYSAGYFSYKWAEVWEADAFLLFKEKGIFDKSSGMSFRQNILEKGGSENPFVLFEKFRGRRPQQEALLIKYEIA